MERLTHIWGVAKPNGYHVITRVDSNDCSSVSDHVPH